MEKGAQKLKVSIPNQRRRGDQPPRLGALHMSATRLHHVTAAESGAPNCATEGAYRWGREVLFISVHERSLRAFAFVQPDARSKHAKEFLHKAVSYYRRNGEDVSLVSTDGNAAFRSKDFARNCMSLGCTHEAFPRLSPRSKGLADSVTHQALREWAYRWGYRSSADRDVALVEWLREHNDAPKRRSRVELMLSALPRVALHRLPAA